MNSEKNSPKISLITFVQRLFIPFLKFAGTSFIATAIDFFVYLFLVNFLLFTPVLSHIISSFCGMIVNFILQKKFIFTLKGRLLYAFLISLGFSLLGIAISSSILYGLSLIHWLRPYPSLMKIIVIGLMFFYNFFTKKFAFEKKI